MNLSFYKKINIKCIISILSFFILISCKKDFEVDIITLDSIVSEEKELYVPEIDFSYLNSQEFRYNMLTFQIESIDSLFTIDRKINSKSEELLDTIDIWMTYKNIKYPVFFKFLGPFEMTRGNYFSINCPMDSISEKSDLFIFFQQFNAYSKRERISKLKQELPKIKLYISYGDEIIELKVTSKTKITYTIVPERMKNFE